MLLLTQLMRCASNFAAPRQPAYVKGGLPNWRLKRALELLETNQTKTPSLAEIAGPLRLHPTSFCRAFKQSTGLSPHRYLLEHRVNRAKEMMKDRKRTLTEIALDCGFSGSSQFSIVFKRITGVSPRDYRLILIGQSHGVPRMKRPVAPCFNFHASPLANGRVCVLSAYPLAKKSELAQPVAASAGAEGSTAACHPGDGRRSTDGVAIDGRATRAYIVSNRRRSCCGRSCCRCCKHGRADFHEFFCMKMKDIRGQPAPKRRSRCCTTR